MNRQLGLPGDVIDQIWLLMSTEIPGCYFTLLQLSICYLVIGVRHVNIIEKWVLITELNNIAGRNDDVDYITGCHDYH